ncbi:MAG TPA: AraC family transcriptional regulator [Longimicrobium sp.]|nr:AraC family transcriptional regulator [Longimicrobium sp.]
MREATDPMDETQFPETTPAGTPATQVWRARWYLWEGGFLTLGRAAAIIPEHSHHALQICVGFDGDVGICRGADGGWLRSGSIVVAPDVPHQFDTMGADLGVMLVDPESREGRWLRRSFPETITAVAADRLEPFRDALRAIRDSTGDAVETARLIHQAVRGLCAGPPPPHALDARIVRALEVIRQMDTARVSQDAVAKAVFLSPSRFAHLFSEQVGLPFRRYLLWRRLTRAMLAVGRGSTLSAAAHNTGFSDSAHLTRTCYQMLGQPPSTLLRPGEFYELPAPFELPATAK